ncbi:hypothetical protein [Persicitalea jodogahamensis]|nr:hypothetical protein [Persicitalea jodogahamensis]
MRRHKKPGRPPLKEGEKRRKVTLMLSQPEIDILKREYEGHTVGFTVFCREKLLNREAATLSKPMGEDIKQQLTDLLKLSSSLALLAKKTSAQKSISEDFVCMSENVKEVVHRTVYSVNEIVYGQSLVRELNSIVSDLEKTLVGEMDNLSNRGQLQNALDKVDSMKNAMEPFLELYRLKKLHHDR